MHLLLDEQINPEIAVQLRKKGFNVVSAIEAKMRQATDEQLLIFAHNQNRVLVTYNIRDFQIIMTDWHRAGKQHSGIIFVDEKSISQREIGTLVRSLKKLLEKSSTLEEWIADHAIFLSD